MTPIEIEYLSRYTIIKTIGAGSFGNVVLAREKSTNKEVALKICSVTSEEIRKYIQNEIAILSLLDSVYFPKLYHFEEYSSFFVIVLEYCSGETLQNYLESKKALEDELILSITKQLLDALCYLHYHRITHRDIKLENIIITDDFKIKICDFGFATFFQEKKQLKDFCGSVEYSSPEMNEKHPYDGPANDVWTLGICILKMCIGCRAFTEISNPSSITGYYSIFNQLIANSKIKNLLKQAIVKDASKRATLKDLYCCKYLNIY